MRRVLEVQIALCRQTRGAVGMQIESGARAVVRSSQRHHTAAEADRGCNGDTMSRHQPDELLKHRQPEEGISNFHVDSLSI